MQLDCALRQVAAEDSPGSSREGSGDGGTSVKVRYIVDLLDEAYALE
jgi:hypothetical protein